MDENEKLEQYLQGTGPVDPNIETALEQQIEQEIKLEEKYGSSEVEALAGQALNTATLGLSDQILTKTFGVSPERLSETRERSPVAAGTGTAVGIIGPAIASGGSSVAAKGVQAVASPLAAATKLGKLATVGAEKLVEGRIRSNAIKEILKTATGTAAEGAALSLGNLVSEEALGKADLNAQNIVASAGAGAMLGAGFGGLLGGAKASVPIISRGIKPIGEKLGIAAKNLVDPEVAAAELMGIRADKMQTILKTAPNFDKELPAYIVNKLELKPLSTAEDLITANNRVRSGAGAKIGEISDQLDAVTSKYPDIMPSRLQTYDRLLQRLEPYERKLMESPSVNKAELDILKNFRKDLTKKASLADPKLQPIGTFSPQSNFKELDNLRKVYQGVKFKGGGASESFKAEVANTLRSELRAIVDETAEKVSNLGITPELKTLAQELKAANKDFYTASVLDKYLPKKLNAKAMLGLQEVIEGSVVAGASGSGILGAAAALGRRFGKSDLRRRATILADIKTQSMAVEKAVKSAVGNFVRKTGKPLRQLSQKSLLNSGFAVDYESKKEPKNRQEAFKHVVTNLEHLAEDQDVMIDRLAKTTGRISVAAPLIAQETQNTLVRSIQFLQSKIPQPPSAAATIFAREYKPSSLEIAKFERYMQAVEHPMTVLEDLQAGTLTREHVEALQVVYPAIYEMVRQEALELAVEPDSDMSYNKKLQLGILLNVPTDPSLEPQHIAALQAQFMPQNDPMQVEAQQGAIRQGNQQGLQKLNVANREQTDVQKVQGRKS